MHKPFTTNIKDKLRALNIQQSVSKDFLSDIFDTQIATHFKMGLANAGESEAALTESLQRVKVKWSNLEKSYTLSKQEHQFHAWFSYYKADEIMTYFLPGARCRAGCKDPTSFFTNSSESLNHVIKQEVEWKESQLPLQNDQISQLEKATVGRGEWHFTSQYNSLMVTEFSVCSHVTDTAHVTGGLRSFLDILNGVCLPNLTVY